MNEEITSKFKFYSIGTVAVDKKVDSYIAEIIPNETNHIFNGSIDKTEVTQNLVSKDRNDTAIPMESKTSQTIEAEWLGIGQGGNRATAPDVYKGERVLIFQFADEDKYFWDKVYNERILRRLERVLYLYSGHMLPPSVENDTKNSYWQLISTLDKVVHFHTSVSNGEKFEWDYKLDTEKAQFTLTDNSGILHTWDAPTATITRDTDNREHALTKDHITQVKRRSLVMGSQLGNFFGPEADKSVQTTVLKPGEYINPVTTGDRRPASRKMAFGQGAFKYEVRSDEFDYYKYYEEVLRYDRHDFTNDTERGKDKFTIWDAVGIHHDYDSTTKSTNFYVKEKAYYRSNNTEFDVRVRFHVNSPLLDLGSHDMNFDTKTFNTTTDNTFEYHITKDIFITGHHNINVNAGGGPTSNVRSESGFIERMMDGGDGNTMREKNTATNTETEAIDNKGNTRNTNTTSEFSETKTVDNQGNTYKDKISAKESTRETVDSKGNTYKEKVSAEETTKETKDAKGNETKTKETAEFKESEVKDVDDNVIKKHESNQLTTEERIFSDGAYYKYERTPEKTEIYELDKYGNESKSKETVKAFDSEKTMDDGTVITVSETSDSYKKNITKPNGKSFKNTISIDEISYIIEKPVGLLMKAYYSFDSINLEVKQPNSIGTLVISPTSVYLSGATRSASSGQMERYSVYAGDGAARIGGQYANVTVSTDSVSIVGDEGNISVSSGNVSLKSGTGSITGSITVGDDAVSITAEQTNISKDLNIGGNLNGVPMANVMKAINWALAKIKAAEEENDPNAPPTP